jgi:uroporphyrinogen decarboxylase
MDSRERVLAALAGGLPDRTPCALSFYHLDMEQLTPHNDPRVDIVDVHFVRFSPSPEEERLRRLGQPFGPDTRLGTPFQMATYEHWRYRPRAPERANPLAGARSIDDLRRFPFPNVSAPYDDPHLARQVADLHRRGKAAGGNLPHLGGELFEAAWRLRGLENFLLDLIERPAWAHFLLDRLADLACRNAEALAQSGVDVLALDDDVGMPGTMMIGPDAWRQFFKPRLARIIGAVRAIAPDLPVLYHSDGYFEPIIADLMEIGVNAINPLQPEHMDAAGIRRQYGPQLALWGAVGRQTTFSFAAPEEIRNEVRHCVQTIGRSGLILCPAYDIDEPDIPWENLAAFLEGVEAWG